MPPIYINKKSVYLVFHASQYSQEPKKEKEIQGMIWHCCVQHHLISQQFFDVRFSSREKLVGNKLRISMQTLFLPCCKRGRFHTAKLARSKYLRQLNIPRSQTIDLISLISRLYVQCATLDYTKNTKPTFETPGQNEKRIADHRWEEKDTHLVAIDGEIINCEDSPMAKTTILLTFTDWQCWHGFKGLARRQV